jgi:predicted XRE-type DNA-binding protein
MAEEHWPTLEEIEAQDRGRIDEAKVTAHRERMRAEQRAHRLAEIRKAQGLTQTDVAEAMHVSQRRVSAVERGDLTRTELGTVASYVQALGGRVEIVANFGDEHIVIGLRLACGVRAAHWLRHGVSARCTQSWRN